MEFRLNHFTTLSKEESKVESPKSPIQLIKDKHRRQKKDFRMIIAGDNGNGKSSLAAIEGELENPNSFIKNPQFAIDNQIHFYAKDWIKATTMLPKFSVNIYDEPAQSGGHHREFMSEANIIITKTVATARFKRLIIPINIPFIDMLDLDIRKLCQIYVWCYDQGKAEVFMISNPKFGGDPWYEKIIDEFTWNMPNKDLWKLYEAKKHSTEDNQYKKYEHKLSKMDKDDRTDTEIMDDMRKGKELLVDNKGKVNVVNVMASHDVGRDRGARLARKLQLELGITEETEN